VSWSVTVQFKSAKSGDRVIKIEKLETEFTDVAVLFELMADDGFDFGDEHVYPDQIKSISVKPVK